MGQTAQSRMDGLDLTILLEVLLDQRNDKLGSESRVLGIEQDLSFQLTLKIADGVQRAVCTRIAGDLKAKMLGVQETNLPMTHANILVSLDGITNIGELNVEEFPAEVVAQKNATAGRIVIRLVSRLAI